MHPEAYAFVTMAASALPSPPRCVVELGSRDLGMPVRPLFGAAEYIGVDLVAGRGVDVVADAASYDPEWPPDLVVCCETLEHAERPWVIVANTHRMLAVGGTLIVTCACSRRAPHSGIDGGPLRAGEHYANVTPSEMAGWLAPFRWQNVVAFRDRGDLYAVAVK